MGRHGVKKSGPTLGARSVADYVEAGERANTQRSYANGIRHFEEVWGGLLPATSQRVAEYVAAFGASQSLNTLRSRLAALSHWHQEHGFADPTRTLLIRQTLKGIRSLHGAKERQAEPLQLRDIAQIDSWLTAAMEAARTQDDEQALLRSQRDRALILLGFWKGFRGDELLRVRVEDIVLVPGQGMTLYLQQSKGDRQSAGVTHRIPALSRLCPVTAAQDWIRTAGLTQGPLFRAIGSAGTVSGNALHANSLIGVLRRALTRAGLADAQLYSGHSMRRGFAGWASGNGWDAKALMEYVGWKDLRSAMRYIDLPDAYGQRRIESALSESEPVSPAPTPSRHNALPKPTPSDPLHPYAISLEVRLTPRKPRGRTTTARRTIEFVCLQRHAAISTEPSRGRYSLTVNAADELDLNEVMGALIEDIHRIADNHDAFCEARAVHEGGSLRWD